MTDAPRHLPDRPSSVRHSHQPDIHTISQTLAGICQTLAIISHLAGTHWRPSDIHRDLLHANADERRWCKAWHVRDAVIYCLRPRSLCTFSAESLESASFKVLTSKVGSGYFREILGIHSVPQERRLNDNRSLCTDKCVPGKVN